MNINKHMRMAMVAALAMGTATVVRADEQNAIDAAAAAAAAAVAQVTQATAALPEATLQQLDQAVAAQNPAPTTAELAQDAGVQTVIQMQDHPKKVPEADPRKMTAQTQVEKILEANGIDKTPTAKRIIQIVDVEIPTKVDPKDDKKFFLKRDMLSKLLTLRAKGAVAASVGSVIDASERARIFGGEGTNNTVNVESKMEAVAKWPLFGVTTLAQAESWDGKAYHMAAAVIWSEGLHKAAKAMLLGEENKAKLGKERKTLTEWLAAADLALTCGPRQMIDPEGNRVFLGIAAREVGRGSVQDMASREAAKASAQSYLVFSLFADVEQRLAMQSAMAATDDEGADGSEVLDLNLAQSVEKRVVSGMSEVHSVETEHPLLKGRKIYVSVYAVDAKSVARAHVLAEELIATRVATELANKYKLGKLKGYEDQVNAAKQNVSEFNRGRKDGNAAIQKKLAKPQPPKSRVVTGVEAVPHSEKVTSQQGVFSSQVKIDEDDL